MIKSQIFGGKERSRKNEILHPSATPNLRKRIHCWSFGSSGRFETSWCLHLQGQAVQEGPTEHSVYSDHYMGSRNTTRLTQNSANRYHQFLLPLMFPRKWPCSLLHLLNREEGATTLRNVAIYPVTEGNIHVDLDRRLRIKFVEIPSAIPAYAQHNFILHSFFLISGFMRTHLDSFDAIQSNVQRISLYVSLYSSRTCEVKDVPFYVVL